MTAASVIVNQPSVIQVDSEGKTLNEGLVFVEFTKVVTAAGPTWFALIDLSNSNGDYKHTETGGIELARGASFIDKDTANAAWLTSVGVITAIDGTEATFVSLASFSNNSDKTNSFLATSSVSTYPIIVPLKVVSGEFEKILSSNVIVTTDLNTGVTIEDVAGNSITPAVGDLVVSVERISGGGEAEYGFSGSYRTVV